MSTRIATSLQRLLTVGKPTNSILRLALGAMLLAVLLLALIRHIMLEYPFSVDLEIPLRAAERWTSGGAPYEAAAFQAAPGATQPFLYPPFVLPIAAVLLELPGVAVQWAWLAILLASAVFACRRLAIPAVWWPFVLAWPPFAEGIKGGNVQILLFSLFVGLFWRPRASTQPFDPQARDLQSSDEHGVRLGLVGILQATVKVAQIHPWLYVLRRRPREAVAAALIVGAIVALTVPLTGLEMWFEWVRQLMRASDPTWDLGGIALFRFVPPGVGFLVAIASLGAVFVVPRTTQGEWIGILSVVGSTSLHTFGLLFLLPAMLRLRREIALLAAMFISTYSYPGQWAGILLVAFAWGAARVWPELLEPRVLGDRSKTKSAEPLHPDRAVVGSPRPKTNAAPVGAPHREV